MPQNNQGAKNRKVNSNGSVIPVKNEVKAAEPIMENACLRFSLPLGTTIIIATAAAGKPNTMKGYFP
jgi:hypothetical protein